MMKKLFFSLILAFLSIIVMCQENKRDYSIGIHVNPNVIPKINFENHYDQATMFDEFQVMGYTFGISIATTLSEKLQFETGLYKYQRGFELDENWEYTQQLIAGWGPDASPTHYFKEIDNYLVLPFSLEYKIVNRTKTSLYIKPSFNINLLYSRQYLETPVDASPDLVSISNENLSTILRKERFRAISPSVSFAIGASYSISEKIDLQMECISDYMIYSYRKDFSDWKHYNVGLKVGARFKL